MSTQPRIILSVRTSPRKITENRVPNTASRDKRRETVLALRYFSSHGLDQESHSGTDEGQIKKSQDQAFLKQNGRIKGSGAV